MQQNDLVIAPLLEGLLILIVAWVGWASHQPLIFSSLGPTAYELIETPNRPSARPYNIFVGNLMAVIAGFAGLWLAHGWKVESVSLHGVPAQRVAAVVIAVVLTVLLTLLTRATQLRRFRPHC